MLQSQLYGHTYLNLNRKYCKDVHSREYLFILKGLNPLISVITFFIFQWVTNYKSVHLCSLLSGTCFRVLGTLLNLFEH